MKRRTFFGAFAALCCVPFAKKEVITLHGVPIVWEPSLAITSWKNYTCTYDPDLSPYGIDYWIVKGKS